ncbi:ada regulatory protein [Vibrio cholerae]|nr:ada regulatory protein [Vibrio cholerae]CRZ82350.1 ada regulatory protein [Vibrio cholerae]CRZ85187.1 ada regulatory protein [Vibrio cholerae]CSA07915.1 ada regulatory protein [Vibrio cholerae]CSC05822.1 ada regulatory protein [Vibrio cholerae]
MAWLSLSGIGPWTVDYAQLRGESRSHCFLTGDLIVKKALAKFPQLTAESVAPWGSYATFHCWSH